MTTTTPEPVKTSILKNLWDETRAVDLDEPRLLVYRSNLLGADRGDGAFYVGEE